MFGQVSNCLKGYRSIESLFVYHDQKVTYLLTDSVTRSPIELFWTAKNFIFSIDLFKIFRRFANNW